MLFITLYYSSNSLEKNTIISSEMKKIKYQPTFSYTPHESIMIRNDSDFSSFPGTGTEADPYRIENYNISEDSAFGKSLLIQETTKFFLIKNCLFQNTGQAIDINHVANNTASIINNYLDLEHQGIHISKSPYSHIEDNYIVNAHVGIILSQSFNSIVLNNTFDNNSLTGMMVGDSGFSKIEKNSFVNCGLSILDDDIDILSSYVLNDNKVNNKKIGYFLNYNDEFFENKAYGQIYYINSSFVTIKNLNITNVSYGIRLIKCRNFIIKDSSFDNNDVSLSIRLSLFTRITRCYIKHGDIGVVFSHSNNSIVSYSQVEKCEDYTIDISLKSFGNVIHHNTFIDNAKHTYFICNKSQAADSGENNSWYFNYWSDYSGEGSYIIDGRAWSVDKYPLRNIPMRIDLDFVIFFIGFISISSIYLYIEEN